MFLSIVSVSLSLCKLFLCLSFSFSLLFLSIYNLFSLFCFECLLFSILLSLSLSLYSLPLRMLPSLSIFYLLSFLTFATVSDTIGCLSRLVTLSLVCSSISKEIFCQMKDKYWSKFTLINYAALR